MASRHRRMQLGNFGKLCCIRPMKLLTRYQNHAKCLLGACSKCFTHRLIHRMTPLRLSYCPVIFRHGLTFGDRSRVFSLQFLLPVVHFATLRISRPISSCFLRLPICSHVFFLKFAHYLPVIVMDTGT